MTNNFGNDWRYEKLDPEDKAMMDNWSDHIRSCKICKPKPSDRKNPMITHEQQIRHIHDWIKRMCPQGKSLSMEIFPNYIKEL